MGRKLQASGKPRRDIDPTKADMLLRTGRDYLGQLKNTGITEQATSGHQIILDEDWLHAAWQVRREAVLQQDREQHGAFHRPWAFWRYEVEEDAPDYSASNRDGHKRWLLENPQYLTVEEQRMIEATKLAMNGQTQENEE
jgi:hypothetical protein